MAGLGFKDFQVGEVLTSADVDGYLMQQTVMRFADAAARGSALGTASGTAVALAEGMVSYLDDTNSVEVYSGSGWVGVGMFSASTAITATDASWSVPALANPIVKVTVIGAGGGGGPGGDLTAGATAGGQSSFACSAGTATAAGGAAGQGPNTNGAAGQAGLSAGNGGKPGESGDGSGTFTRTGSAGVGGAITVAYLDMSGVSTANVTIGAGGNGATGNRNGGAGGRGEVVFEYRAA